MIIVIYKDGTINNFNTFNDIINNECVININCSYNKI